jgi:HTH-type transcriptional regulator / antitoxin HipB
MENKMKNITDFEDLLKEKYGKKGTPRREKFDADSLAFILGVMLKEARKQAKITQKQLAKRTGTKKSYISRIERGKSDI